MMIVAKRWMAAFLILTTGCALRVRSVIEI